MTTEQQSTLTLHKEDLLRNYAELKTSLSVLLDRGFSDFIEVLAGLHELGLRAPIAPLTGPSAESRLEAREILFDLIEEHRRA